jgi:release factor glutamine methyltransferase
LTAPVTIGAAWREVRDRFRTADIDTPELDARLLAQKVFAIDAMGLVRREREIAPPDKLKELDQFAQRRLVGEPISRIAGEKEFWSLKFALNDATLVPRPETEQLVEEGVALLAGKRGARILDLGTGSGAIIVSIVEALPKSKGFATDISEDALAIARQNAQRHGVAERIEFRKGSWWQAVPHTELFDLIVSNPPYIATDAIAELSPEVRVFDPKAALDGGFDGLEAYRAIAAQAARRLNPGGKALLEIGFNQGETVSRVFARAGFGRVELLKDLAGLERVVLCSHS